MKALLKLKQKQKPLTKVEETAQEITELVKKEKIKDELKHLAIFASLITVGVAGRVALQFVPSVEPIIPIAVLIGLLYGAKEGFVGGNRRVSGSSKENKANRSESFLGNQPDHEKGARNSG